MEAIKTIDDKLAAVRVIVHDNRRAKRKQFSSRQTKSSAQ